MSPAEIELHGSRWGIKDFGADSHEFWTDVAPKRVKVRVDHAPMRSRMITRALSRTRRDVVGVPRADLLGRDMADVDQTRKAILKADFSIYEILTGTLVEPGGENAVARSDAFMESAAVHFKASAVRARQDGQKRTGNKGGRPPSLTLEQKTLILPVWIEPGHGGVRQREKLAGALVGRSHVAASNMARWFDCDHGTSQVGPKSEVQPKRRQVAAKPKQRANR